MLTPLSLPLLSPSLRLSTPLSPPYRPTFLRSPPPPAPPALPHIAVGNVLGRLQDMPDSKVCITRCCLTGSESVQASSLLMRPLLTAASDTGLQLSPT